MLASLRIKNLALVSELALELEPGLNVITGETGAGKSVIIGALTLLTGQRADRSLIRSGEDTCSVEGVFDLSQCKPPIGSFLEEHGIDPCEAGQLVIKRSLSAAGANRQHINGSPTTLAILAQLGEWLVDLHGPHDHQSLLHPSRQLTLLDAYAGSESELSSLRSIAQEWARLKAELEALAGDDRTFAQQIDLLRFQVREIEGAKLHEDEEPLLLDELSRCSNASRLLELSRAVSDQLNEGESSLLSQAGQLGRTLHEIQRLDPGSSVLSDLHSQALEIWRELSTETSRRAERLDTDPARQGELEERLSLIQSLKRKYGGSLAEVIAFGADAATRLARLEGRTDEITRIEAGLKELGESAWQRGVELSAKRSKAATKLTRAVSQELSALGFRQSRLDVSITPSTRESCVDKPCPTGIDKVEFQFAPNPGEPAKPLRAIASSGEMARVMLAMKTVLAAQDEIPVLVFDEVDANVGGETAQVVGQKMAAIARRRQVLCITHLAPVAASATAHYLVSKEVRSGRTLSEIERLPRDQRVRELARMLGGQSEAARRHAEDLLSRSRS
ncbi:MAG: DNA repair protein RecN [Verrucomicrobia bacterium]|nr:DNA repair protein RecN [Verrucomicrobiota bacterium]